MELPIVDNYTVGYAVLTYYGNIRVYNEEQFSSNLINDIKKFHKFNKYIEVNSIKDIKFYIDGIKVPYTKTNNDIYTIIYKNFIHYIHYVNIFTYIKYEIICPDIDERIEYLKDNGMFNNFIGLIV